MVSLFGVDRDGGANLDELAELLSVHDKAQGLPLVAVHLANNETGVIQPVREISKIVKSAGGVLVIDAVQAAGRIELDLAEGAADYFIVSGHKIGAPAGIGAFIACSDLLMPKPLLVGGGHEKGHRAGTENLAGIAGFGAAAKVAAEALGNAAEISAKRDRIEQTILGEIPDAVIHGRSVDRICNTSCFSIPGMKAETAQIAFDLAGIALSAGSACSSGRTGPSHVMAAMGVKPAEAVRVSIGMTTDERELELFAKALKKIAGRRKQREHAA
jgi:cysteine desulfurase